MLAEQPLMTDYWRSKRLELPGHNAKATVGVSGHQRSLTMMSTEVSGSCHHEEVRLYRSKTSGSGSPT